MFYLYKESIVMNLNKMSYWKGHITYGLFEYVYSILGNHFCGQLGEHRFM